MDFDSEKWLQIGRRVLETEAEGLLHVCGKLDASFARAVEILLACKGRVAVTGVGKSGLVGRKIAATLSSTGTPAFYLHPTEALHGDLGAVRDGDVVIAISYSGKSLELKSILPSLRSMGAVIVAITGGLSSPLAELADIVIDGGVLREACPLELAPTTSTTAALAVGDALALCLIEARQFTADDFKLFHPGGALGQRLGLSVKNIMHESVPLSSVMDPVEKALGILDDGGLGAVVLTDGQGRLAGIITDGDVRRAVCRNLLKEGVEAASVMTPAPRYATPGQSVAEVMDLMEQKSITVLPVVDENMHPVGVVHLHDILGKGQISFAG